MKKFLLYWLIATACIATALTEYHDYKAQARLDEEEALPGEAFFEEPITLDSGDIDACGDLIQKNILNRKPKFSTIANVLAEFRKIDPKTGSSIVWSVVDVSISLDKSNVQSIYDTDIKLRVPKTPEPGQYQWVTTLNFPSPSGFAKSVIYQSNVFEVFCTK